MPHTSIRTISKEHELCINRPYFPIAIKARLLHEIAPATLLFKALKLQSRNCTRLCSSRITTERYWSASAFFSIEGEDKKHEADSRQLLRTSNDWSGSLDSVGLSCTRRSVPEWRQAEDHLPLSEHHHGTKSRLHLHQGPNS